MNIYIYASFNYIQYIQDLNKSGVETDQVKPSSPTLPFCIFCFLSLSYSLFPFQPLSS